MAKEVAIKILNSSVECRPPKNTSNGAPDQIIIIDHTFMKILSKGCLVIGKSVPDFGSHPLNAELHQRSRV